MNPILNLRLEISNSIEVIVALLPHLVSELYKRVFILDIAFCDVIALILYF